MMNSSIDNLLKNFKEKIEIKERNLQNFDEKYESEKKSNIKESQDQFEWIVVKTK